MTERAQALEAAIEKARRGLVGFAAEIQDGRVPVVGAVRDHLVLNLGTIASFLADALVAVQPPPPAGSPTHEQCHDVVCNAGREHPRGAKGVSCSCAGRDTAYQELTALKSAPVAASEPPTIGQVRLCGALHVDTGAVCELPLDHAENHRGSFSRGIAQWPYIGAHDQSSAPVSPVEPTGHNDLCSWCLTQADHVAASEECYERNSERGRSASKPVEPTPEPPQDGGNPK